MRILVTGGAGFIGSHFIRLLLARRRHVEIFNFDKLTYAGNLENLADVADDPRYHSLAGRHRRYQTSERGLYRAIGAQSLDGTVELAMLWVLNLSDGCHSLLDIAERAGLKFELIKKAAEALEEHGLLKSVS